MNVTNAWYVKLGTQPYGGVEIPWKKPPKVGERLWINTSPGLRGTGGRHIRRKKPEGYNWAEVRVDRVDLESKYLFVSYV